MCLVVNRLSSTVRPTEGDPRGGGPLPVRQSPVPSPEGRRGPGAGGGQDRGPAGRAAGQTRDQGLADRWRAFQLICVALNHHYSLKGLHRPFTYNRPFIFGFTD